MPHLPGALSVVRHFPPLPPPATPHPSDSVPFHFVLLFSPPQRALFVCRTLAPPLPLLPYSHFFLGLPYGPGLFCGMATAVIIAGKDGISLKEA